MRQRNKEKVVIWDDILMISLAVASGLFLLLEYTTNPSHLQSEWYENVDMVIAAIFLVEFFIKFFLSKSKWDYLGSNWWYLLASIPITTPLLQGLASLQLLRFARLARLVRVTTGVKEIHSYFRKFTEGTYLAYALIICIIIIFYGAIVFYSFEHGVNSEIASMSDSLVWVAATVTTVGYGGVHPVTLMGHAVGVTAMICGIIIVCILIAFLTSSIQKGKRKLVRKVYK